MKCKIGQVLTSNVETVVEKAFSEEKVIIPKGNQVIVCNNNRVMHLRNGMIQPLGGDFEVDGFDTEGIAKYVLRKMKFYLPFDEMCDDYEVQEAEVIEAIQDALSDIL